MTNARLDEAQAGIKIAWRNINNLRYADDTILMAESKEELKSLLTKVKEKQIDGETMKTIRDFILGGSKITADGDWSHEIKRHLLLRRKAMTNLDSILKSRDIALLIKVCLVKALLSPVIMYGCESWTIKKAECRRTDVFELWCWRRLFRVPWTARRPNQLVRKEISPEYSLEGLMLQLKLQYFGHLMQRTDSLEKTLTLGKVEGRRRRGWQRMRWLDGITDSMDMIWASSGSWWWTGKPGVLQFMGSQRVGHDWAAELNWLNSEAKIHVHILYYEPKENKRKWKAVIGRR